jgi:hypothetical protein
MSQINPNKLNESGYKAITPRPPTNPAQAGPNCGLYALSYVMRHWYLKLQGTTQAIAQPLPARKVDVEGPVKLPATDPNKQVSLRSIAKSANKTHPLTYLGELVSADSLLAVARAAGFEAKSHAPESKNYLTTLFKLIDANHPAIVSLDVDQDIHTVGGKNVSGPRFGCPGKFGGEHAHWATIVAYEKGWIWDDVVMFHWQKYFQFAATDLQDSANQLIRFSGQTWYKTKDVNEQVLRDPSGNPLLYDDMSKPIDPKTGKHPIITKPTERGKHWQKLVPENQTRDLSAAGVQAWDGTGTQPGKYANTTVATPPLLTNRCNGLVVKTVFGNTNLNLRNVIIEVVPQGIAFA